MNPSIENTQTSMKSSDLQLPRALTWNYTEEEWAQFMAFERERRGLPLGSSALCGIVIGLILSTFSIPAMLQGAQVAGSRFLLVALMIAASIGFMFIMSLSEVIENRCRSRFLRNKSRIATVEANRVVFAGKTYDWHRLLGMKQSPEVELVEERKMLILHFTWKASNGRKLLPCHLRIPVPQRDANSARRFFKQLTCDAAAEGTRSVWST